MVEKSNNFFYKAQITIYVEYYLFRQYKFVKQFRNMNAFINEFEWTIQSEHCKRIALLSLLVQSLKYRSHRIYQSRCLNSNFILCLVLSNVSCTYCTGLAPLSLWAQRRLTMKYSSHRIYQSRCLNLCLVLSIFSCTYVWWIPDRGISCGKVCSF